MAEPKLTALQKAILTALKQKPEDWLPQARFLPEGLQTADKDKEVSAAMNVLLEGGHVEVRNATSKSKDTLWRAKDPLLQATWARQKGLGFEDNLVLQAITKAGNMGIWTKDMKRSTGLQQPQITKILKGLETRKLVKSVKSVDNASKKIYMLHDLDPSTTLSGGAWYTDNEFDAEFIEVLHRFCLKMIVESPTGTVSLSGLAEAIQASGISKQKLTSEDTFALMRALTYDDVVEVVRGEETGFSRGGSLREGGLKYEGGSRDGGRDLKEEDGGGEPRYKMARLAPPATSAQAQAPCGVCPVIDDCTIDGPISPQRCVYFQKWLQF